MPELRILPVEGLPEIAEGDDLGGLIAEAAEVEPGDVVVVSQKVVSKAEGRIVRLDDVEASDRARELAANHDPRQLEVILRESARVVRARAPLSHPRRSSDGHGFATDEALDLLGTRLSLPPFLEPRRAQIEAGLKSLD